MNLLLPSLIAIAAVDSLNPSAIALQIYLLSTPKPIARSISYILGVFSAYWLAGMLTLLGLRGLIVTMIAKVDFRFSETRIYTLQFLLGIVLLIVGLRLKPSASENPGKRPQKLTLARTFLLGMSITILELPTALPYVAAIEQIARAKLDLLTITGFLGLYNLVFVFPQIILLSIYIIFQQQSVTILGQINRSIAIWSPKILRGLLLVLGILLMIDSIAYSFGQPLLKFSQLP
jgi:cytochrome c biogenesis protein CcdA